MDRGTRAPGVRQIGALLLKELGAEVGTNRWEDYTGMVSFARAGHEFTYLIDLTISPKGITGTTHMRAPGQESAPTAPWRISSSGARIRSSMTS